MQAIDVAIEHGDHGARRSVALPGGHSRLETIPREQTRERIEVLGGVAREQTREASEAAHGELVEARFFGAIEDDERAGRAAARDEGNRHELAGDLAAARMLEFVG